MIALFRKERATVAEATETAKRSINTTLVVSSVACLVAVVALIVALAR